MLTAVCYRDWLCWGSCVWFGLLLFVTVGRDAGGCLWGAAEASGLAWAHSAPWRRWTSHSRAGNPLAVDLRVGGRSGALLRLKAAVMRIMMMMMMMMDSLGFQIHFGVGRVSQKIPSCHSPPKRWMMFPLWSRTVPWTSFLLASEPQ